MTTLHAAAAARVIRTDPDFVIEALQLIETNSRRALAEVDRALALLSGTTPAAAPDARQFPELMAAFSAAGMTVVEDIALPDDLPNPLSEFVYRIVQEAGTNALRHGVIGALLVSIALVRGALAVRVVSARGTPRDEPTRLGPGGGRGWMGCGVGASNSEGP